MGWGGYFGSALSDRALGVDQPDTLDGMQELANFQHVRIFQYMYEGNPETMTGIKVTFSDGATKVYEGRDLPVALMIIKENVASEPGSTRLSDQPLQRT